MSQASATQERSEQAADKAVIRPFQVNVPEAELTELRRRIAATRWPTKEVVGDRSQGVQLGTCGSSPATGRPSTTGASARRD